MSWQDLDSWWTDELAVDPGYEEDVTPLALQLLDPQPGRLYLDVGCGDGRMMRHLARSLGVDDNVVLLRQAVSAGPVVRGRLPSLSYLASECVDGALVVLVLEHISDHVTFFSELARVTRPGGVLALVANHPYYTAPDSAPIEESDGETTWRPGRYFSHGYTDEPAGERTVRFYHRPMGDLLTTAAIAGWDLRKLIEQGPSDGQIRRHPPLAAQRHFPRLLGARWVRRSG